MQEIRDKMMRGDVSIVNEMPKIYCCICGEEIIRAPYYAVKVKSIFRSHSFQYAHKSCGLGRKKPVRKEKKNETPNTENGNTNRRPA